MPARESERKRHLTIYSLCVAGGEREKEGENPFFFRFPLQSSGEIEVHIQYICPSFPLPVITFIPPPLSKGLISNGKNDVLFFFLLVPV